MNLSSALSFDAENLQESLDALDETQLDDLDFGVIGFDAETIVGRYNTFESKAAGLPRDRVVGHPLFTFVAPCMNNFMVAHRFEEAQDEGVVLDASLNYVLTLRMRPTKVVLRLLASPTSETRYVLVRRL
ncbi:phosphonate transporter [Undibacterium sp. RuRC25W]|uniref:phosphonate transporter n=1 Tax=Undibacterium sp. RuRC25W TaxID=3413047 RepID=UPI003BF08EAF